MAEVKIDEINVSSLSILPPEVSVDEVSAVALTEYLPDMDIDQVYSRGISPQPASIRVDSVHVGAIRQAVLPTRFKEGYKKEVLDTLGNLLAASLPVANYDIEMRGLNQTNPRLTNLRLSAKKVSGYRRYSDVTFRRADAEALGKLINYDQLKATDPWPLNTTAQIIARINTLFGTTLTDIDFVEADTVPGQDRILTAKPESFYFHPGTTLNIGRVEQNERSGEVSGLYISEAMSKGSWTRTPYRVFATDFTPQAANLATVSTTSSLTSQQAATLVTAMDALCPNHYFVNGAYNSTTADGGLRNAPYQLLTLPAETDALVDNSGYYNRALVIDLALAPWATGFRYLILHFNV